MRRQTLRASPAAIRRAAHLYRPLDQRRPPIAERQPDAGQRQLDLADAKPIERQDIPETK